MRYTYKDLWNGGGAIRHVFPTHQKAVLTLLSRLSPNTEEVWIFGSSVGPRCGQGSDLDVCLVGELTLEDTKNLWHLDGIPLDIVVTTRARFDEYAEVTGHLFQRVRTEGLLIWKREEGLL